MFKDKFVESKMQELKKSTKSTNNELLKIVEQYLKITNQKVYIVSSYDETIAAISANIKEDFKDLLSEQSTIKEITDLNKLSLKYYEGQLIKIGYGVAFPCEISLDKLKSANVSLEKLVQ